MTVKFGTAGNPESFYAKGYKRSSQMPLFLSECGLDAYEYQCGRGVMLKADTANEIKMEAEKHNITVSLHSPYFISLSTTEESKIANNIRYITESATAVKLLGGNRVVVHSGSCGKVSREQFVQTLANMEGINKEDYLGKDTPFTDVKKGAWYEAAVEWARQTGIVAGLSETVFGIGKPVTREQMARLLREYAVYKGKTLKETEDLSAFVDAGRISSWAIDGFRYCVASGIFKGNAKNELNPRGNATRAELATMIVRFSMAMIK